LVLSFWELEESPLGGRNHIRSLFSLPSGGERVASETLKKKEEEVQKTHTKSITEIIRNRGKVGFGRWGK